MKYIYSFLGILICLVVTIFTFWEDNIYYNYAKYTITNDTKTLENIYFYNDNFNYIDNYKDLEIHNKKELYETIYYIINSGTTNTRRYFSIDYTDFQKDYNDIFSEESKDETLVNINNFVHPYNTFESINVSLKGYVLDITIGYKEWYPKEKQDKINNKVNEIINELIKENMTDKDKVKTIHDYIINNTIYDENFCIEQNPEDCIITSPYQSDTAYGVLFEHYGICSGYTDLMAIFLNKLGIANYRVTNDSHTWNAVKIDNKWYHLDTTWDDPINKKENILSHTYFLITTDEDSLLKDNHIFDKEIFIELS